MIVRTVCIGLFLIVNLVQAQVTISEFLNSVWNEPELNSFDARSQYLNTKPYRLAPVQKMEFRSESNQLDPDRQEFSLRVNPANPWEIKNTSRYFQTYQQLLEIERSRTLRKLLLERYEQVIAWLYYNDLLNLREADKANTEKLLRILEGQRASDYFNAEKYFELRFDLIDKVVELEEILFEIDNHKRVIEGHYEAARLKSLTWYNEPIIQIGRLEQVMDSIWSMNVTLGEIAYREKRLQLTTDAWKLEKSNINVGFLQARYQEYRIEQDRSPWSLSMGVTIPIFNPNKGDMTRRQLDSFEAQADLDKAKYEQQTGMLVMREKIKGLVNRYREVENLSDSLENSSFISALQTMKNNNPAVAVRAQGNVIKMNVLKARLRKEIFTTYLQFLEYAEAVQQTPLINYLSPALKPINP